MCNAKSMADFQWALGLNRLSLRMIGVWPEANRDHQRHEVSRLRSMRVPFMMLWLVLAIVLPQTYALAQVYRHLDLVVDNLITNSAALTSVIKLFLLWKNRYVLEPAIRATEDDWSSVSGNDETTARNRFELESMTRQANRARIFTASGYVIMFGCFAGFVFTPLFGIGIRVVNNITDPLDGRFFPLQTYYPYDIAPFPLYELTYASQLLAGSFVGIAFSVPDNFFGALVFHACAQCEILNARLRDILQIGDYCTLDLVEREGERFHRHLRDFVRRHVQIIGFVHSIEKSFNVLVLVQVLCLSVVACFLAFGVIQSIRSDDGNGLAIVQVVTLVATLLNLMIHTFVYCVACELLAQHSMSFFPTVYNFNWFCLRAKHSRPVLIVSMRTRHHLKLTAGKFFDLSLHAYMKILKNTAGYISVLLAVSST
ncbi:hypothetical protein TKK_0007608 [Trichogramma kaykai]